jgi:hypothetical protein
MIPVPLGFQDSRHRGVGLVLVFVVPGVLTRVQLICIARMINSRARSGQFI